MSRIVHDIDPATITVAPDFNIRDFEITENSEHVLTLSRSIRSMGIQNPLTIRFDHGKPILVDGESRLRAVLHARSEGHDIPTVPCIEEAAGTTDVQRVASLLTRNSGKTPNILERGLAISRLLEMGETLETIAQHMGTNTPQVGNIIQIFEAPEGIRTMIADGSISGSFALEAMRKYGDDAEKYLTKAVKHARRVGSDRATQKHLLAAAARAPKSMANAGEDGRANPLKLRRADANRLLGALIALYNDRAPTKNNFETVFEDVFGPSWRAALRTFKSVEEKRDGAAATEAKPRRAAKTARYDQMGGAA